MEARWGLTSWDLHVYERGYALDERLFDGLLYLTEASERLSERKRCLTACPEPLRIPCSLPRVDL